MKNLLLVTLTLVLLNCSAQPDQKFNLNFEKQSGDKLPKGWIKWGYHELSTDSISHSGQYAAKITSGDNGDSFGSIAYKIPANYKGDSIRLVGFMKIRNVENGFAGLLLRIDGGGTSLAFDNMQNQNINGTRDWEKYSITLNYPEGAENIFVAGLVTGKGEVWFDDFELFIDDQNVQTLREVEKPVAKAVLDTAFDEGSKITFPALTPKLIENLELLGRVWGFLKYHHSEVAGGNYNWDYELFRILPEFIQIKNKSQRDQALIKWISAYGELSKCENCEPTSPNAFLKPDLSWIKNAGLSQPLQKNLNEIYENRHQGTNFYIRMSSNVGNPEFTNEKPYSNMPYPDEGYRLLMAYKYWNIINYFFPYRHLTDKDWNEILKDYIPKFIQAKDELEYELVAVKFIGEVQDTHANLWGGANKISEWKGIYYPPVHVQFIENKLVVTDFYNPEMKEHLGLEIGDIITKINGRKVEHIVERIAQYYPASNEPTRLRDISADLLRSNDSVIQISYIRSLGEVNKPLKLYDRSKLNIYHWYRNDNEKCYRLLDNIGYITLKSIKEEDIPKIKEVFRDTKGIIIDIRNYPSTFVPFLLGSYFVSSSTPFAKFTNGNIKNPGEFTFTKEIEIPKPEETYKGKLIVLVNELSQSQAEYTAMAFRAGDNTTIIGSTTAGADGNISNIQLPGDLRTMISGIGVYYPDGKETQRIGIVPDIEVKPTIKGIKEGRDEVLEKAIELINE